MCCKMVHHDGGRTWTSINIERSARAIMFRVAGRENAMKDTKFYPSLSVDNHVFG